LAGTLRLGDDHLCSDVVAACYALLGEQDQAFVWLNKEYEVRSGLVFLKADPVWDKLRSDPRFEDLLRRIGLPQ
jgi:hypothetical protein